MDHDFYTVLYRALASGRERDRHADVSSEVWEAFLRDGAPVKKTPAAAAAPIAAAAPAVSAAGEPDLAELGELVRSCRKCRLCETRTHAVFGEGHPHAALMFVGEGPGADEDRTGRPFVGKAGQLLDNMIAAMKFDRADTYIANVVKCRPPGNRAPEPDEAAACLGYLKKQIALIRPQVIVILGGVALSFLLKESSGITRMRGHWQSFDGIPVMPTFHPAFLLRQPAAKRETWSDLKQVMQRLGKL